MVGRAKSFVVMFAILAVVSTGSVATACPFCAGASQTFSEEIASMDAVVIARLLALPKQSTTTSNPDEEVPRAKFKIEQVIKGQSHIMKQSVIETIYFGEAKKGQSFLIMGVDPPKLMWSTPLQLSDGGHKYISEILTLPKKGADRLAFFQNYLEHTDEMLARDAYDEFAKAPYSEVISLKERMKYEKLIEWIKSTDVPASRRRLYLTMLGVCGSKMDLPMIEEMLKSKNRQTKAGLDAMIGCYLTIKGADGMPLVEDLFLKNKKAEYADTYAAIMALRFHATEAKIIPRDRILKGFRHMLERPQLADLVIPDLARWEDWSVMKQLVQLFKDADEKSSWVRVPVINYLRACPKPEAKEHIAELKKVDPAAVKRANTFFPFTPAGKKKDEKEKPAAKTSSLKPPVEKPAATDNKSAANTDGLIPAAVSDGDEVATTQSVAARRSERRTRATPAVVADQTLNPFLMLGVALLAATGLLVLLWSILRGTIRGTA